MSEYREEILLRSKDVDMFRHLRTSELFRLLQEASIRHTEQLGGSIKVYLVAPFGNNGSYDFIKLFGYVEHLDILVNKRARD